MKKVLSLVLVIAMVLSSMSFAFAAVGTAVDSKFEDVTSDYKKAVETLAGLGIVTGYEDGTFRPEKVVTRAEMAKLMVEILGYGNLVAGAKSNFKDTQGHWADAWIAVAAGRNIVIGTGDGKFLPDRTVSYDEVLTMVVRGLGYTDNSNEIKSMSWPTNFKVKAAEIGVTDRVKLSTSGADRGGVAQALFNALEATLVTVDNEGNVRALQDKNQRDLPLITRIAVEFGTKDYPELIVPSMLDPDDKNYAGDIVDLEQYLYEYVKAYKSKVYKDVIVYVAESYSDTVVGSFRADNRSSADTSDNSKVAVKLADGSTKVLDLVSTSGRIDVYYNGEEIDLNESGLEDGTSKVASLAKTGVSDVKVVLIDKYNDLLSNGRTNPDHGKVKAIVVSNPTYAQKVVAGYKADSLKLGGIQLPKKGDKVDLSKVTVTGAVEDIKDIKAGDVVVAYAAGGVVNAEVPSAVELVVVRDTVDGTVTKVNKSNDGSTTVYIDGTKYTRSEILGRAETFDVGYEGTFFLDDSGRLFAQDTVSLAGAKDYAVVIEAKKGYKAGSTTADRIIADADIKLINASGEVVTYKIDKDAKDGTKTGSTENLVLDLNTGNTDVAFRVPANVVPGALVKYKLDDNKVITRLELVKADPIGSGSNSKGNVETDSRAFAISENAVIFNIKTANTNKDNYSVVKVENLPRIINIKHAEFTDGGEYKVIVSQDADRSQSGTFALITNVNYVWEKDEKVAQVTAMVDGKEVVYLAKDKNVTIPSGVVDTGKIAQLTLSNGKIKDSVSGEYTTGKVNLKGELDTLVGGSTTGTAIVDKSNNGFYISDVKGDKIRVKISDDANHKVYDLGWFEFNTDNIVVYELNNDEEFVEVGNVDALIGTSIVGLYDTTLPFAANGNIEVIVVK